jgi:hypothetical protein
LDLTYITTQGLGTSALWNYRDSSEFARVSACGRAVDVSAGGVKGKAPGLSAAAWVADESVGRPVLLAASPAAGLKVKFPVSLSRVSGAPCDRRPICRG